MKTKKPHNLALNVRKNTPNAQVHWLTWLNHDTRPCLQYNLVPRLLSLSLSPSLSLSLCLLLCVHLLCLCFLCVLLQILIQCHDNIIIIAYQWVNYYIIGIHVHCPVAAKSRPVWAVYIQLQIFWIYWQSGNKLAWLTHGSWTARHYAESSNVNVLCNRNNLRVHRARFVSRNRRLVSRETWSQEKNLRPGSEALILRAVKLLETEVWGSKRRWTWFRITNPESFWTRGALLRQKFKDTHYVTRYRTYRRDHYNSCSLLLKLCICMVLFLKIVCLYGTVPRYGARYGHQQFLNQH